MAYRAGDNYIAQFATYNPTTAVPQDADTLPLAIATRNGTDDAGFTLSVAKMATGRYRASGTIPAYTSGDKVQVVASATVAGVAGISVVDMFVIDNKLQSEIYADMAKQNTLIAIPTNPLLTTDLRLDNLNATVSSRSTQTSVNSIPTNPLLTTDNRLNNLDALISSRSTLTAQQVWEYTTKTLSAFGFDVTVATNNDKTGYQLTAIYDRAKDALKLSEYVAPDNTSISAILTDTSTDGVVISQAQADKVWSSGNRTLTSFGSLITDIWNYTTRGLTDKVGFTLTAIYDRAKTALGISEYTAPDNAKISAIKVTTDKFLFDSDSFVKSSIALSPSKLQIIIKVYQEGTTIPIENVKVLLMNEGQTVLEAEGTTNINGEVILIAEAGVKKVRLYKPSVTFVVPETITIITDLQSFTIYGEAFVPAPLPSPDICEVYDFLFESDGATPVMAVKVFAEMKIINLPHDYNGRLHIGGVLPYMYDEEKGYISWQIVKGAAASVRIQSFFPKKEVEIPTNVNRVRLASL